MIEIKPEHLRVVQQILKDHFSGQGEEIVVWAFGSRVHGAAKQYSDLDLAIEFPKVPHNNPDKITSIIDLKEAFDESILPYSVDILAYDKVSPVFQKIIDEKKERILF